MQHKSFYSRFFAEVLLKEIVHRLPQIENAEIRQMVNGPESFTPDGKILMGAVPEVYGEFDNGTRYQHNDNGQTTRR